MVADHAAHEGEGHEAVHDAQPDQAEPPLKSVHGEPDHDHRGHDAAEHDGAAPHEDEDGPSEDDHPDDASHEREHEAYVEAPHASDHRDAEHDAGSEPIAHDAQANREEMHNISPPEETSHEAAPLGAQSHPAADEGALEEPHPNATQAGYDAVEEALGAALFSEEQIDQQSFPYGSSGYIPMQTKPGALQYQPGISVRFGRLPNKVDLRPLMPPVEDQGGAASGVAHAVAGAYAYWTKRATKQSREISSLFVYYNGRWRDGAVAHDGGSAIQLCMEALSKFGACSDAAWPLDMRLLAQRPGADAYQDAAPPRIQDMAQVPLKLQAWKQALAEGKPIVFGTVLFEPFDACSQNGGVVPLPTPSDVPQAAHGLHALCAVGYCDSEKVFIVRNCRGPHWGDNGYCYMPYAYVLNPRLNDDDCWVFVPKSAAQPPREAWSDDTRPVTNGGSGVGAPIETHSVEDYANVAVDLFEPERRPYNGDIGEDYARYVALAGKGAWHEMDGFDHEAFFAEASQDPG